VLACGNKIGENKNDNGGSIRRDDIYNGKGEKLVLALLSDLYLELEVISVDISGPSSYLTLHYLCYETKVWTDFRVRVRI